MKKLTEKQAIKIITGEDIQDKEKYFFREVELKQALKKTRQEGTDLPIKTIARIIKDVFGREEIEILKRELI